MSSRASPAIKGLVRSKIAVSPILKLGADLLSLGLHEKRFTSSYGHVSPANLDMVVRSCKYHLCACPYETHDLNRSDRKQPTIPLSPLTVGSVSSIPTGSYQGKANTATRPCELHEHTHDPSIAQKIVSIVSNSNIAGSQRSSINEKRKCVVHD
jgi:hypothetical protein